MIFDSLVTISQKSVTLDGEGRAVETWATFASNVPASVQPAGLTAAELKEYGVTDLISNAKKVFLKRNSSIVPLMKLAANGETYEIRGVNHWLIHSELLCMPLQGV